MAKGNNAVWDSIYRQWIWADHLRNYFEETLPEKELNINGNFTIEPYWMFMCLWYGILFSVLDALKELEVEIPEVQDDINVIYPILKKYRNGVFHIQKNYWPDKWLMLILDESTASKIERIHKKVGEFLLKNLINETSNSLKKKQA